MIREVAEITAIHPDSLQVSTQLKTGCSGCEQQSTCGAGIISKAFSDRRAEFLVQRPAGSFAVGQQVELLLPEAVLTRFSLLIYILPILILLLSAILLTQGLGWPEGQAIIGSLMAFAASFWLLRRWLHLRDVQVTQLLSVQQIT
ncbi:positive regulator of sigma E activity [Pseudidiomarina salinarum]|uniref:Positive regulator of sigma E activity n=1 Tax=Pseudidiomarina salinarum TaxID=435908 RepID=A0A094LA49_9GAMM|nr:SoxR reducing system RseC family protein [Pseudidiomarina salinarum]KFZ31733.1 positive regulator of sigma E activity [Pseudidiomarina salinarum]